MRRTHMIALQEKRGSEWVDVMKMHATVNKAKGAEELDGAAIQSPLTLNFDVRYCSEIAKLRLNTQNYRIVYGKDGDGRPAYFKVTEYDDYFEKHRNVRLTGVSYRG